MLWDRHKNIFKPIEFFGHFPLLSSADAENLCCGCSCSSISQTILPLSDQASGDGAVGAVVWSDNDSSEIPGADLEVT